LIAETEKLGESRGTTINNQIPQTMTKNILLIILLVGSISFNSFSQDPDRDYRDMENYYKQGDYVNATLKAISFLRVRPNKKHAQEILSMSFNMATEDLKTEINDLKDRSKNFSGDGTVDDRRKIIDRYKLLRDIDRQGREIVRVIPKQKVPLEFDQVSVSTDMEAAEKSLDESIGQASEMHYQNGLRIKASADRESQKSAAKEFRTAMEYTPNYKDCSSLYATAQKNGTTRVAIIPFVNKSGVNAYGEVGEMTSDKLRAGILNNAAASEFIEMYTRDQLDVVMREHNLNMTNDIMDKQSIAEFGKALGIHIIITGKVMQVSAEYRETIHDGARLNTVRVATGTRNYVDSKGYKHSETVWGDVSANNYYHHKTAVATINGSYEMIDIESGRVLATDQFRETWEWINNWSTYQGDQRAASSPSNFDSGEQAPPSKTELANKVIDRLGNKIASDVINLIK
jgi:hypothetical protein